MSEPAAPDAPITGHLAGYLAAIPRLEVPDAVRERAKQHLLDGLAALISGATLRPGRVAGRYVGSRGGLGESTVAGTGQRTAPELAALANGMCAHADETDDVNDLARLHPGASIIPAALAVAEAEELSGEALLKAVIGGYNVGCSVNIALFESLAAMQRARRSPHGIGQAFGATAAAAALAGLDEQHNRYALSYTAQQVSGILSFYRDQHHIGKAFASAGMQAHTGVRTVEMVRAGFTDITDVMDTSPNVFDAFGDNPDPARLVEQLEHAQHVMTTDLKQYPVGMPIQAAAQALGAILERSAIAVDNVERIDCRVPSHGARIVDSRSMPDIHLQYILALLLLDGAITFQSAHDYARQDEPAIKAAAGLVNLIHDDALNPPARPNTRIAIVDVHLWDGRRLHAAVDAALGSRLNPMAWEHVEHKARDVLSTALTGRQAAAVIELVRDIESLDSVRRLRPYLAPSAA